MKYTPQSTLQLAAGTSYVRPPELPAIIHLDDPAVDVMTDFNQIHPVTIKPDIPIDDALERMKSAGVRLLLVCNDAEEIIGLITSHDIQGENPIAIVQDQRIPRSQIPVEMVMRAQPAIDVLELAQVCKLNVGHIVETLNKLERQHILVVEIDENSAQQRVCGLFSMSQIKKQLGVGRQVAEGSHSPTVAELVHELGT